MTGEYCGDIIDHRQRGTLIPLERYPLSIMQQELPMENSSGVSSTTTYSPSSLFISKWNLASLFAINAMSPVSSCCIVIEVRFQ